MKDRNNMQAPAERTAEQASKAKKPFLKPVLERHALLPEVTGFSF